MYRIKSWLFFGGADKVEKDGFLTKDEAERECTFLNVNNESTYSGFYVEEY